MPSATARTLTRSVEPFQKASKRALGRKHFARQYFLQCVEQWLEEPGSSDSLCGYRRNIGGVLRPSNGADVQQIMRFAGEAGNSIQIQPVALGRNWGFGSHLPATENAFLLDLSRLNRIRSRDLSAHSVELEPGATQGALDDWLGKLGRSHFFNVTGAGTTTSVIGNALEKGIGYSGSRHLDLLDLEVVLPGGELIRTSKYDSLHQSTLGAALGPEMTGLFCQGNFGVITAARIALFRRTARMGAVLCKVREPRFFAGLIGKISDLVAEGACYGVPHIFNRERIFVSLAPHLEMEKVPAFAAGIADWTALLPLKGSVEVFRASAEYLSAELTPFGETEIVSDEGGGGQLNALLQGRPSDFSHASVGYAVFGPTIDPVTPVEETGAGLIHVAPVLPLRKESTATAIDLAVQFLKARGYEKPQFSLNVLSPRIAALIIPIAFDRRSETETIRAQETASGLLKKFGDAGMLPYRLGLSQAEYLPAMERSASDLLNKIQTVIDPTHCMALSRYEPLWRNRI